MIGNNIKNRKLGNFTELEYEYFHSLFSQHEFKDPEYILLF